MAYLLGASNNSSSGTGSIMMSLDSNVFSGNDLPKSSGDLLETEFNVVKNTKSIQPMVGNFVSVIFVDGYRTST